MAEITMYTCDFCGVETTRDHYYKVHWTIRSVWVCQTCLNKVQQEMARLGREIRKSKEQEGK